MRSLRRLVSVLPAGLLVALAAGGAGGHARAVADPEASGAQVRQGGTLTVLAAADVDTLDPGITYYTFGQMIAGATHRALLGARPDDPGRLVPDLAESAPQVASDGRAVTIRIRPGIRFSPPVERAVTSRDVKYAIERAFFRTVDNPYAALYFADIVGAKPGAAPGTAIAGIETPDEQTVVLRLAKPSGGLVASALVMPMTAPVPADYAAPFDAQKTSTYAAHQVATGPYMIENDALGRIVGYQPGKRIHLVRNPNWNAESDFRPARLDAIEFQLGNTDSVKTSRRILTGSGLLSGDFSPPQAVLNADLAAHRPQFAFSSGGGINYMPMNTQIAPFKDINVRRAVIAGFDRAGARRVIGGRLAGDLATHFLPPDVPGFEQAGGATGTGAKMYAKPGGDRSLAATYLRRAGYRSGRYEGTKTILEVSSTDTSGRAIGQAAKRNLERLGFRVKLRLVGLDRMFRLCGTPAEKVHVCPFAGWIRDFPDAQTILDPLFNGASIIPKGNNNLAQLDVPVVNKAIDAAKALVDPQARAAAWGAIDRRVTALAPAVALFWPKLASIRSADVTAAASWLNGGLWDISFTGLAAT